MTLAEGMTRQQSDTRLGSSQAQVPHLERQHKAGRVGASERAVSLAAGGILAAMGLGRGGLVGMAIAAVGGDLIFRGAAGYSPAYHALDVDTAEADHAVEVRQAMLVNKPAEQLYQFWRDFQNLPRVMEYLERVEVQDGNRSHWVARAPSIVGGQVSWDAEITRDEPNQLIEWRSIPGSTVETAGQVRFQTALGDRGTEVHVYMTYYPPAGKLGNIVAAMMGNNPKRAIREGLRNFKRLMEIGEILTIIGQPHGTCTGQGTEYTESGWKPMFT